MKSAAVAFAGPVLSGMEERWRRSLQELASVRRADYDDLLRRLGITRHRVWLVRAPRADLAVVYVKCAEPETLAARLSTSTEPFDLWLKARLAEFHGCDLTRPNLTRSAELIFDHARNHADTTLHRHRGNGAIARPPTDGRTLP